MTFQYLRGALNYKAVTKYYDFNLKRGYKPSRMQNGWTTSRSGNRKEMFNWTQTSGKNQSNYGDVNDHIAKQHPLLKSTTAWVTAPCSVLFDDDFFINTD